MGPAGPLQNTFPMILLDCRARHWMGCNRSEEVSKVLTPQSASLPVCSSVRDLGAELQRERRAAQTKGGCWGP